MTTNTDSGDLVSVVVPTHYRNDRLRSALESVADQEHRPIEVIVVDGSDDEQARPVVEAFADGDDHRGANDHRADTTVDYAADHDADATNAADHRDDYALDCTYVHQEHDEGPQAARNIGAERATGSYVQFLDDDDRLAPTKLSKQLDRFGPRVGVVYCGMHDEERGEILPNPVVRGNVLERALELRTFPCINSTMLIDRDALERALPLRHRHGADDTGLKIDLALQTQFDFVAEPLVVRGRTGSSLSDTWSYLDGRWTVIETYAELYRTFPERVRQRAVRETHYQIARKLLEERGWSPRATMEHARAAYHTPDDRAYHLAACLGSVFGRPGTRVVDWLFDRDGT